MNHHLETTAKIAFCIFLVLAASAIFTGTWYWMFGIEGAKDLGELLGTVVTVTVSILFFLIAKALRELSQMMSNDMSFLNRVSEMAASVSAKAQAAAKAHTPNDSD